MPSFKKKECDIRLILASKSSKAFFTAKGLIRHGSVKLHGSPSFCEDRQEQFIIIVFFASLNGKEMVHWMIWRDGGSRVLVPDLVVIAKAGASSLGVGVLLFPIADLPLLPLFMGCSLMAGYHLPDKILRGKDRHRCLLQTPALFKRLSNVGFIIFEIEETFMDGDGSSHKCPDTGRILLYNSTLLLH
nr:hypothetical protein [Tanacetum cinerariifolium]